MMTIHSSKGLEFDYVFLPSWVQDEIPAYKSDYSEDVQALEEERRIAFVGVTRAR